jgi:hypothetical protein
MALRSLKFTLFLLAVLGLGPFRAWFLTAHAAQDPNAGLPSLMKAAATITPTAKALVITEEQLVTADEPEEVEAASLFKSTPTPTPLPSLNAESEEFFTQVDALNEFFHQLKQTPRPTPTPSTLKPPIDPPRTVFRAMLKKGAVVKKYQNPAEELITNRDYYVMAEIDSYYRPIIILDRQGNKAYQTARSNVVDLTKDLDLSLSPVTRNPRYAWLREEMAQNDPNPLLIHRLLGGPGESAFFKTSLPNLTDISLWHFFLTYQVLYHWPFPVRFGLSSTIAYHHHDQLAWPTWSLGPSLHWHILWGQQQFELTLLWQTLLYAPLRFTDPASGQNITTKGQGSFWQIGLNYLFSFHGHLWPCGIFYQRGSYYLEQPAQVQRYDLENTSQRLHAIGVQIGHQWN